MIPSHVRASSLKFNFRLYFVKSLKTYLAKYLVDLKVDVGVAVDTHFSHLLICLVAAVAVVEAADNVVNVLKTLPIH